MSFNPKKPAKKRRSKRKSSKSIEKTLGLGADPSSGRKPKKKRKIRIKGLLILLATLSAIAAICFFIIVDSLVAKRLASGESAEGSRVLSDIEHFRKGQKIPLEFLRQLLIQRNYHSVVKEEGNNSSDLKLETGEYLDLSDTIKIATRAFKDNSGQEVPSTIVTVSSLSSSDFSLEPVALAQLGTKETRASRFLPFSKTPEHLKQAVIAIEDERFYSHFGIDPIGILRALATNITKGKLAQGGSTITQQLAKNLFFSPRRSIVRKLLEIPAAISLETRLDKSKILELYLNEVYLGQDGATAIHGMGEAAHAFFGKDASKLDPAESAMLAGLIQAPSLYAPKRFPERAKKRRDTVIEKMCELKYLDNSQCQIAKNTPLKLAADADYKPKIPFFMNALQEKLAENINLDAAIRQGINVRTGLSADIQNCAESAIQKGLNKLEKSRPGLLRRGKPLEAALVAIEPFSGKVKAWVGGRDFSESQFDRVSKAKRQIGSTIKPFVYLTALDGSLNNYKTATAISILSDRPMELEIAGSKTWNPENYDHEFRGDVTLRYALEHSLNIPAVYISQKYGVKALTKVIERFRLQDKPADLPAIALGAIDTSLLKLTAAYSALANGGIYVTPRFFISTQDRDGYTLSNSILEENKIAEEGAVFVLTSILQGVVDRGTGSSIRTVGYKGPAAGKTGTTNEARDAWFVGYSPQLAVGVWLGYDDNKKIGLTGGVAAAPIWGEFMSCVSKNREIEDFVPPSSVSLIQIDAGTGLKLSKDCPGEHVVLEYFVKGTEPQDYCSASRTTVVRAEEKRTTRRTKA